MVLTLKLPVLEFGEYFRLLSFEIVAFETFQSFELESVPFSEKFTT